MKRPYLTGKANNAGVQAGQAPGLFRHGSVTVERLETSSTDRFRDRRHAGQLLGEALVPLVAGVPPDDLIALGLARGGVVVAAEVAARLGAVLDAIVIRKIGSPFQPELAIGAVGPGGVRVYNRGLIADLGLTGPDIDRLTGSVAQTRDQLDHDLRGAHPAPRLDGKTALLIDDGLATGASMQAALAFALRSAASVIVAVPVAAPDVLASFEARDIGAHALIAPASFGSVGAWYDRFDEVTSDVVRDLLDQAP